MFDKLKQLKQMRDQALKIQQQLQAEEIVVERGNVRVVISGDQKIKELSVGGISSDEVINALNDAIKQSQQLAAKKLQEMSGGLTGMMQGLGGGTS
ncbi:MAG: YbaB/EbfC family nucleoid-associated protein [Candidatus Chisholmbacteria bacterium]|nr:YbaB/EbfC family nucleoid-associated protein [Candidatus Chisholmbacteria bacterium]